MPTKDELENRIYEKMSQENAAFLAEMKTKSPDEIISRAYEIACRDNLLMLFEDETSPSELPFMQPGEGLLFTYYNH